MQLSSHEEDISEIAPIIEDQKKRQFKFSNATILDPNRIKFALKRPQQDSKRRQEDKENINQSNTTPQSAIKNQLKKELCQPDEEKVNSLASDMEAANNKISLLEQTVATLITMMQNQQLQSPD